MMEQKGGLQCILKYREYLVIECEIIEEEHQTALALLYIQYITKLRNKDQNNAYISDLRTRLQNFLQKYSNFNTKTVLKQLQIQNYLSKEICLLLMKQGKFSLCFETCVTDVQDDKFLIKLAEFGSRIHQQNRLIYYNMFKVL